VNPPRPVPLFPLPQVFLFPGQVLPLHIFEPRYRRMVEDSLDGPGRLVIGTVSEEHLGDLGGSPPVLPIAGLGEIARHEKQPDGRFWIWLVGLARCRIREVESALPYRSVEVEPVEEVLPDRAEEKELRKRLCSALKQRGLAADSSLEKRPLGQLTDLLLMSLGLPYERLVPLYGSIAVGTRARLTLEEHAKG
jgi:Lon protease-like protein